METGLQTKAPPNDAEIISQARSNMQLFEPLYNKYFSSVFRYVYRMMDDREDAADLTANVFVKAMGSLQSYNEFRSPFIHWLLAIARNEVYGFYRKRKSEMRYHASLEGIDMISHDTEYESPEGFFPVKKILEMLPQADFELIDLKYFGKKSVREISEITGMNENRIRVKMHRIRERMGKMIRNIKQL